MYAEFVGVDLGDDIRSIELDFRSYLYFISTKQVSIGIIKLNYMYYHYFDLDSFR